MAKLRLWKEDCKLLSKDVDACYVGEKSTLAESWCYLTTRFKMFVLNCYEVMTGYEKGCC